MNSTEAAGIALDQLLLDPQPVGRSQRAALVGAGPHQALQGADADAGQGAGDHAVVGPGEGARVIQPQLRQRLAQHGLVGQRHADARDARMESDLRVQVVEVVGDQNARERQIGERRFGRPVAKHACETAVFEAGPIGGHDVIDTSQDDRDVFFHFAAERTQVAEIAQVAADPLQRGLRLARQRLQISAAPFLDDLAAALRHQVVRRMAEALGDDVAPAEAVEERCLRAGRSEGIPARRIGFRRGADGGHSAHARSAANASSIRPQRNSRSRRASLPSMRSRLV